jgi:antitoxin (DNA-binding transcriptional repressor) of toxin-antitoxin stability system
MRVVNVHQAKTHLSRLIDDAHAGETIVLAKAGKHWARLMPLAPPAPQRIPGRLRSRGPLSQPNVLLDPMDPSDLPGELGVQPPAAGGSAAMSREAAYLLDSHALLWWWFDPYRLRFAQGRGGRLQRTGSAGSR